MKKHYETHVEDTDKLISVAGPVLDYKSWYEQYRKLMEEQAQRKYGLYTPTSEGDDDDFPSITGMIARYSALGLTNEQMAENPVWKDLTGNRHDLQMKNFAWKEGSGISDVYPGALVFDGVDDYGTCDNFPVLTKEKGYTVVALRQWIEEKNSVTALASNSKNWNQDGAFVFEYNNLENNYPNIEISFGSNNMFDRGLSPYSYQTSKSYNGNLIESGSFLGSDKLVVAKANENLSPNSNIAIWELVFLDHDATEEELTKIKDYFVKTYPWLFPNQAWTVTGKTNEDEDRATIANITGNGNDLVLSNFGFAEGSGYNEEGEYAGYLVTDGVDDRVVSRSFTLNKDWTIVGNWKTLQPEANKSSGIVKQNSLFIYNHVDGLNISINDAWKFFKLKDIRSVNAICSDGRIYLNDWTEIIDSKQQTVNESVGTLVIGILGNVYTSLAFKNLGIYNNQILSKDDCIKAYNYLQTLKAK